MKNKFYFVADSCIRLNIEKNFYMPEKEFKKFAKEAKILCENLKDLREDEAEYLYWEAYAALGTLKTKFKDNNKDKKIKELKEILGLIVSKCNGARK